MKAVTGISDLVSASHKRQPQKKARTNRAISDEFDNTMSVEYGLHMARDIGRITKQKVNKNGATSRYARNHAMQEAMRAVAEIDDGDTRGALVIIELLRDTLRAEGNTAPQWRDLNNANTLFMLHTGLKHLGNQTPDLNMVTVPFTFNLTHTLLARATVNTQRTFASYLLKRITEALKRTLGRSVDLFFVVEIAGLGPTGRPHLHGEVLLTGDEVISERRKKGIKPVRQAFHCLNSYTEGLDNNITEDKEASFKNRAIKFEWSRCDLGWPDYIAKHLSISSLYYDGKAIAKTQGCTQSARELHNNLLAG